MKQAILVATQQRNNDTTTKTKTNEKTEVPRAENDMSLDGSLRLSDEIQASAQLERQKE